MKKALLVLIALALLVWIATWFRTPEAVATSGAKPWPGGLGPLKAADRFPPQQANDAARRLTALGKALPANDALTAFVRREIARGQISIGEPTTIPDVSRIRELLLAEKVVWDRREGIGGGDEDTEMRVIRVTLGRTLVASALAKARGNDPSGWEDLRAAWILARSLEGEPQMMTRTSSMSIARMINAVSWKMPLPAPAWLGEVQQQDYVRPLLESFHYQSASYWDDGAKLFPTKFLADSVEKDRGIADSIFRETRCAVDFPMNDLGVDLRSVWRRAFRYRAEREAATNALRIREERPIEPKSVCSDGAWTFDGTVLRFSREIPTSESDTAMPLGLKVEAPTERRTTR